MNLFDWLTFIVSLATTYATSRRKDTRALGYLRLATLLQVGQEATDAELQALKQEYSDKVANREPTTPAELVALEAALAARSKQIQTAAP